MGGWQTGARDKQKPQGSRRLPRSERKTQMLEAAARLFGERGYAGTSMDDIAAACGITKPMLYAYFSSKDGLYRAMIERAGSYLVSAVSGLVDERDPVTRLLRALEVFMQFVSRHGDSWRLVFSGGPGPAGREIALYREQILMATIETLCELRPEGMSNERARAIVTPYAHALLGSAEAGAQWGLSTPGAPMDEALFTTEKVLRAVVEVVRQELAST